VAYDAYGPFMESVPANVTVTAAGAQMYFIYPDHLNTPRSVTNFANQTVWSWINDEPFGNGTANDNPSGLGAFAFNLWFPGQYFDKETNLHYNYFRDYDPAIGRYIQSDPIGLRGGINTYGYVGADPLGSIDSEGLLTGRWVQRPTPSIQSPQYAGVTPIS